MSTLNAKDKSQLRARMLTFTYSGFASRLTTDICRYVKSLVGRDFKALAQMAPFVILPHVPETIKPVWIALSKVTTISITVTLYSLKSHYYIVRIVYCKTFSTADLPNYRHLCQSFVEAVKVGCPELLKKPKIHLILHLPDNMQDFGPPSAYNTER